MTEPQQWRNKIGLTSKARLLMTGTFGFLSWCAGVLSAVIFISYSWMRSKGKGR